MCATIHSATLASATPALTPEEVRLFGARGFLGPFTLCSPDEIAPIRETIEREVLDSESAFSGTPRRDRFRDHRVVYDLCSHPAILERAACLLGPDLLLFASGFFAKDPGYPEFPWHADGPYWMMNPTLGLTAWISLTEATLENGCLGFLPGTHRRMAPHDTFGYDRWSSLRRRFGKHVIQGQRAQLRGVDEGTAVDVPVPPGQFILFAESTLHRSGENRTDRRRTGLAVRLTTPVVKIRHEQVHPQNRAILVRGEDRFGWNRLAEPPD